MRDQHRLPRRAAVLFSLLLAQFALGGVGVLPASAHGSDVVFDGAGWGHGLGMGQWGARGFAANGYTFDSILTHFYQGTVVSPQPAPYAAIRVGLVWDRDVISGQTSDGAAVSCSTGGSGSLPAASFSFRAITVDGSTVGQLRREDGSEALGCAGATTISYAPGSLRMLGHEYRRGSLELSVRPGTMLVRAIALISGIGESPAIDVYLWGLGEMPSSWPDDALKAQAVAGRTYALEKITRLGQHRTTPACDCALLATTGDQAYVGYDKEAGTLGYRWVNSVEATRWLAVTSNGAFIEAYYHSSSGGHTENNELQWGGSPRSYLRGVPDPYDNTGGNPHAQWSVRFSWDELEARFNANPDTAVGTLSALEIVPPLGVSGRVTVVLSALQGGMRIVGSAGTRRVSGETIRTVLGLKSNLFRTTNLPSPDLKTIPAGGYTLRSDGGLVAFGSAPAASGAPVVSSGTARAVSLGGRSGKAGYVLDAFGTLYPFNGATPLGTDAGPRWPGWDIARDVELRADGISGYVLDGWGGLHPFGGAISVLSSAWEEGKDASRRLVLRRDGASGYVVKSDGSVHPFGSAPAVAWTALATGRTAQGLILRPDGISGYVVDQAGNLLPFGAAGMPAAVAAAFSGTVSVAGRSDGASGYLTDGAGNVKAFGRALEVSAPTGGSATKDIALVAQPEGYVLDGWGGLHPFGGAPPAVGGPFWSGWDIARRVAVRPDGAGYVMDAFGGLHPFGTEWTPKPAVPGGGPYWNGWPIARDLVLLPGNSGAGYILDGFGGTHPFGGAPAAHTTSYWNGWDIARRLALNASGTGGYVLDGFGGLHPFAVGDNPLPPKIFGPYFGWDIARDVVLTTATSGWVLDGFGGSHPFGDAAGSGSWYWHDNDLVTGAGAGGPDDAWVVYLDQWGGLHSAPESAPAVDGTAYWVGWPIGRDLAAIPR